MRKKISKAILASLLSFTVIFSFTLLPVHAVTSVSEQISVSRTSKSGAGGAITGDADLYSKDTICYNHKGTIGIKSGYSSDKEIVFLLDTSGINLPKSPFDYGLFSGSQADELLLQGRDVSITGDVHTNNALNIKADSYSCTNSEYVTTYYTKNVRTTNTVLTQSNSIPMEPIYQRMINPIVNTYTIYKFSPVGKKGDASTQKKEEGSNKYDVCIAPEGSIEIKELGITVKRIDSTNTFQITDELRIPDKTSLSFDGNLNVFNNLYFSGNGMLSALNDIDIYGRRLDTSSAKAFIYSESGHIFNHVDTTGSTYDSWFNGIMYAPNGYIRFQSTTVNVRGSVIADNLIFEPGQVTVVYEKTHDPALGNIINDNTYLTTAVKTAKDIINRYRIDSPYTGITDKNSNIVNTKVGILKYDSNANIDGTINKNTFYDIQKINNTNNPFTALTAIQTFGNNPENKTGKSNLGDGLRRACEILNSSTNKYASKFIIVFTGSMPNTYTLPVSSDTPGSTYQFCNGDAVTTQTEKRKDTTTETTTKPTPGSTPECIKSVTYANEVLSKNIIPKDIVPIFINCLPSGTTEFNDSDDCFSSRIVPNIKSSDAIKKLIDDSTALYYAPVTPTATPTPAATSTPTATPTPTPTPQAIDSSTMNKIYSDIIERITPEIKYIPESIVFKFHFIIPEWVNVVKDWEDKSLPEKSTKDYVVTISKDYITESSKDPTTLTTFYNIDFSIINKDFLIKYIQDKSLMLRKYNKLITFPNTDYVQYTINYIDPRDGSIKPAAPLKDYYSKLKVNVKYKIDIT